MLSISVYSQERSNIALIIFCLNKRSCTGPGKAKTSKAPASDGNTKKRKAGTNVGNANKGKGKAATSDASKKKGKAIQDSSQPSQAPGKRAKKHSTGEKLVLGYLIFNNAFILLNFVL